MIRTHMTFLIRLARPAATLALLSAGACAVAGPALTSRAGIEYVPATFTDATSASTLATPEEAIRNLGNEGVEARGRTEYEPVTVTVPAIVSKVESLSATLRSDLSANSTDSDNNRDRAGNHSAPVRYESFQAWWEAMQTDRSANRPVTMIDTMHRNRSGIDDEPGSSN
ncbi:MAG: hypothetical protein U1F52_15535 [Burkholderiales bacterium]